MIYRRVAREQAVSDLRDRLTSELEKGMNVLWLVSGGSNIKPTVAVLNEIPDELTENLSIMLIHEFYGPAGHENSNSRQFNEAGLDPKKAHLVPALQSQCSFEDAIRYYNHVTAEAFAENDVLIAQLGMGVDGHVAGILPHTIAATHNQLVVGYEHEGKKKLTLTLSSLEMMDAIYVLVYGEHKRDAIMKLHDIGLAAEDQPAQFLKQLDEVYFYNDQIDE